MSRIPELERELVAAAARLQSPRRVLRPVVRVALAAATVALVVVLVVAGALDRDDGGRRGGQRSGTPPSQTKVKVGIDVQAGVRLSLDGRRLTVSLLSWAPDETRNRVSGARIRATCGVAYAQVGPEGDPRNAREERTRLWPSGRDTMRFRFGRDISRNARWCRVEDPAVGNVAYVVFATASVRASSPARRIELAGNQWAPLFASSDPAACERYMAQPACERATCERAGHRKIENCSPPSPAFRKSFRDARVEDVVIVRKFAGVRFSNGKTVRFIHVEGSAPDGVWWIDKFWGDAGRKLLEQPGGG